MTWESKYPFYLRSRQMFPDSFGTLKTNEFCFIRKDHKCGKMYSASKSCFVACPNEDELDPILELITEKLNKFGVETIIAVRERAYGQDIFCTKICGKIIEARFCMVFLNDEIVKEINIPNPNVYYEYGLMTSLRKHVIPLQKEDLELAFNIQSYDTIKYNPKNISSELERALKDALRITESSTKDIIQEKTALHEKSILRNFELAGFELKPENWFLYHVIEDTDFKGFHHFDKNFYAYVGKIDRQNEFPNYIKDLNVIIYRTEKEYKKKEQQLHSIEAGLAELQEDIAKKRTRSPFHERTLLESGKKLEDIREKMQLMSKIYVGFIINPNIDQKEPLKAIENIMSEYGRFKLVIGDDKDISFEDAKVILAESL